MTSDELIAFAKDRGIAFDLPDVVTFKSTGLPKPGELKLLVNVVVAVPPTKPAAPLTPDELYNVIDTFYKAKNVSLSEDQLVAYAKSRGANIPIEDVTKFKQTSQASKTHLEEAKVTELVRVVYLARNAAAVPPTAGGVSKVAGGGAPPSKVTAAPKPVVDVTNLISKAALADAAAVQATAARDAGKAYQSAQNQADAATKTAAKDPSESNLQAAAAATAVETEAASKAEAAMAASDAVNNKAFGSAGVSNAPAIGKGTPPLTNNWIAFFSSGAEFLNPYFINVPSGGKYGTLTNAGSSTVGYLQFDLTRRWVFAPYHVPNNNTDLDRFPILGWFGSSQARQDWDWEDLSPDFQYDLGFHFANGASSTNKSYSAQTLSGSDLFSEIGVGFPLWRNDWENDDGVAVQLALAGSLGVATDESFEKVHVNEFLGGTLDVALTPSLCSIGSTNNSGFAEFRVGYGHLDFPSLTGTANQVNLDGNGYPIFEQEWVPELDASVLIPLGTYLYLNVQASAWPTERSPNQWHVRVGATVPWTTVAGMFQFIK